MAKDEAKNIGALTAIGMVFRGVIPPTPIPSYQSSVTTDLFTLSEYNYYRFRIDTPLSASEEQARQSIAQSFGVTPEQVRQAVEKIQAILARNGWCGVK